jgi:uncharacterized iron-regulated protein
VRRLAAPLPCPRLPLGLALFLAALGCRPDTTTSGPEPTPAAQCPACPPAAAAAASVLEHELRIFDAKGRERSLASLLDELAEYDVVLLGETHLDDVTHRFEHAVLEGLARRRDGRVVLSMEMFERDAQPVLDRYLAGEIDETTLLAEARPWGNYRPDYRPLVETARARKLPVIASNTPRAVLRKAAGGAAGYAEARAEHPEWLPEQIFPATDAYWARVDRTIRGHGPPGEGDRTYGVQNLWDNTMADSIASAAKTHPEHTVLHVVGAFHVEQHDGTVAQLRRRAPKLDLATLTVVPTSELARAKPAPSRADFVVHAQAYANGPSGDELEVAMPATLGYRLHVPAGPAPADGWPLLVWLVDDEQRADDAVLRWRMALGREAAVIVVEPPHRTLARGGWLVERWGLPASLSEDLSAASVGLGRIVEYARRGLPVRAAPVLVAGEGAGATLALWSAQYGADWDGVQVLAIAPDLPRALGSAAIPDERSGVQGVEVLGTLDDGTLAGLQGAGLVPQTSEAPAPGQPRDATIRGALGLAPTGATSTDVPRPDPAAPMAEAGKPIDVRVAEPSALSESWGALYAGLLRARGHDARLVLGSEPGTPGARSLVFDGGADQAMLLLGVLGEGKGLPRPPDVFGGAVVLLIPRAAGKPTVARWAEALAKHEAAQGFFKSPYRVVREGDDAALRAVLDELRAKGRTEVLIVPAELCATVDRMQRYVKSVESRAQGLSLHWLPGLGYHLVRAFVPED